MNIGMAKHGLWTRLLRWFRDRIVPSFELGGLEISDQDVLTDLTTGCK